jgi:Dual specificity phosphatase, catalytic domain
MSVTAKIWKGLTIVPARLAQHGLRTTWLWLYEKVLRIVNGHSPAVTSKIGDWIYVGGQHYVRGLTRMQSGGIGATLNLREEADDTAGGVAFTRHLWLPTPDDGAPTMEQLLEGVAFIREAVKVGQGVYIHCAQGVGRAPTMAAAYLISEGDTLPAALAKIRLVRPFITPTPVQLSRLEEWAKTNMNERATANS